jgi:Ca-activated chloride channel family protein
MPFANPHLLWSLLVVPPLLVLFFWWSQRQRQRLMTQFIDARLLPGLLSGWSPARRRWRYACFTLAVMLLLVALARPRWGFSWETVRQKGLDIVIAIDTSKSMLAADVTPNRLARAKLAALELMQRARTDRLGLVAFAGDAFLQCPLTIDEVAFRQCVEALDVNLIPQGGTALAPAIRTALGAFKEADNIKVLVLLSDGEDHERGALEAAQAAARLGLKIFAIGIGTPEGDLLRVQDAKGRTDYVRDENGNVVKSRLNETLLREIAEATGGFYLPLRGAKTIDTLYEQGLAPLPKSEGQEKLLRRYHERYHWPLAAALLLLFAEMLLPESAPSHRRTAPGAQAGAVSATPGAAQPSLPASAAVVVLLLLGAGVALASPRTGLREYRSGRFDRALQEFERALEKDPDDPRLHFYAGAAAYRDGRYDVAAEHFTKAAAAPDLKLQEDAFYNLGNSLYRRGETAADPQQTVRDWEAALKQYEHALRLSPNSADARYNHEFVKQRLEELKRQQPPPPQQGGSDQNRRDSQNQSSPQAQQEQSSSPAPQQPQPSSEPRQREPQQAREPTQPPDSHPEPPSQQAQQQPQPSPMPAPQEQRDASTDTAPANARPMTPEEARRLLDAARNDERVLQFAPDGQPARERRALKDW